MFTTKYCTALDLSSKVLFQGSIVYWHTLKVWTCMLPTLACNGFTGGRIVYVFSDAVFE